MTDYERGVEQASAIYKEVIRGYVAENTKLRELVDELWALAYGYTPYDGELDTARDLMRELGIEAD